MTPPAALTTLVGTTANEEPPGGDAVRFGQLMHRALEAPELAHLGTRAVQRAVRRFLLTERREVDLIPYVIAYADPTGNTAVANVMRQQVRR